MKALKEMDNVDKGELLCKLFPEELENIQLYIKYQCEYFLENESEFRQKWIPNEVMNADLWYTLVKNTDEYITKYKSQLFKKRRWFSDQFFDGINVIFTMHCLIEYSQKTNCNAKLQLAIRLLFGIERVLKIRYE